MADPDGPFEPFIATSGLILVATELYRRYMKPVEENKTFSATELIQHRERLRPIFEKEILRCKQDKLRKDAIIRHVDRVDSYPNVDDSVKGISPWFKVSLIDTYHKGILVALKADRLNYSNNQYTFSDYTGKESDVRAYLVGKIPYENIEAVNIDGDEYYYFPHIYCHFPHNDEPYEELVYCQEVDMGHGHTHYTELITHKEVTKNSKS